jgi:hypothetical protein
MGVVVFAKVQGLVKSESTRTRRVRGLYDFASPRTFVKTTAPVHIFCGSNIPDKNSKSIEIFQKSCENTLVKKNLDGKFYYCPSF